MSDLLNISYQGPKFNRTKNKKPKFNQKKLRPLHNSPIKNTNLEINKITANEIMKILFAILYNREFINMPHNKLKKYFSKKYSVDLEDDSQYQNFNEASDKLFDLQTFAQRKYVKEIQKLQDYFIQMDQIKSQLEKSIKCLNLMKNGDDRSLKITFCFGNSRFSIKDTFILMVKNQIKRSKSDHNEITSKASQFQQDFKIVTDLVNFLMKLSKANKNCYKKCFFHCTFKDTVPVKIPKIFSSGINAAKINVIGINNDDMAEQYEVNSEELDRLVFDQNLLCLTLDRIDRCPMVNTGTKKSQNGQNFLRKIEFVD